MMFIGATNTKPGTNPTLGGDQGVDAQEEEKEVKYGHRHGTFREQLYIYEGRQS